MNNPFKETALEEYALVTEIKPTHATTEAIVTVTGVCGTTVNFTAPRYDHDFNVGEKVLVIIKRQKAFLHPLTGGTTWSL